MSPEESKKTQPDIGRLSHDLRNILGTIYNYAQLLDLSLEKKGMDKERDAAREILRSVEKIEQLLRETLDSVSS